MRPGRSRAPLMRATPYEVTGDATYTPPKARSRSVSKKSACDHCKAARQRCTVLDDSVPWSSDAPPSCSECSLSIPPRHCTYGNKQVSTKQVFRSYGALASLEERLAYLEKRLELKIGQSLGCMFPASAPEEEEERVKEEPCDEDGWIDVDEGEDGVRRAEMMVVDDDQVEEDHCYAKPSSSALDPELQQAATINEQQLVECAGLFELAWLCSPLEPAKPPSFPYTEDDRWTFAPPELVAVAKELQLDLASALGFAAEYEGAPPSYSADHRQHDLLHPSRDPTAWRSPPSSPIFTQSPSSPLSSPWSTDSAHSSGSPHTPFASESPPNSRFSHLELFDNPLPPPPSNRDRQHPTYGRPRSTTLDETFAPFSSDEKGRRLEHYDDYDENAPLSHDIDSTLFHRRERAYTSPSSADRNETYLSPYTEEEWSRLGSTTSGIGTLSLGTPTSQSWIFREG